MGLPDVNSQLGDGPRSSSGTRRVSLVRTFTAGAFLSTAFNDARLCFKQALP